MSRSVREFIPDILPCGTQINEKWIKGKQMECCRTVCPGKSNIQIEVCHSVHKRRRREDADSELQAAEEQASAADYEE